MLGARDRAFSSDVPSFHAWKCMDVSLAALAELTKTFRLWDWSMNGARSAAMSRQRFCA